MSRRRASVSADRRGHATRLRGCADAPACRTWPWSCPLSTAPIAGALPAGRRHCVRNASAILATATGPANPAGRRGLPGRGYCRCHMPCIAYIYDLRLRMRHPMYTTGPYRGGGRHAQAAGAVPIDAGRRRALLTGLARCHCSPCCRSRWLWVPAPSPSSSCSPFSGWSCASSPVQADRRRRAGHGGTRLRRLRPPAVRRCSRSASPWRICSFRILLIVGIVWLIFAETVAPRTGAAASAPDQAA